MVTLWVPARYFIDRRRLTSSLVPFFVRYCYVDSRLVDTHVKFHGGCWLGSKSLHRSPVVQWGIYVSAMHNMRIWADSQTNLYFSNIIFVSSINLNEMLLKTFMKSTRALNCPTDPIFRFCFIKNVHRRTLLEGLWLGFVTLVFQIGIQSNCLLGFRLF